MVVTARRIELARTVRVIRDEERLGRIEVLNESNVYDQTPEYLEYVANMEAILPDECLACESLQETYNEVTPEAVEYRGLQCIKGGCDRG